MHGLNVHVHAQAGTDVMKSFKMQLILWEVLCSLVSNFQTFKSHCEKIPVEGFLQSYIKNDFSERPSSILFIEKNAQGLTFGTHQIWIQQVQIVLEQFKKLLYIAKQGRPQNFSF